MTIGAPPLTLVHCIYSVAIGGQEMVVLSLVERMDRRLYAPRVLCFHGGGELTSRFESLGVPVDVLDVPSGSGGVACLRAMRRYFRAHRPAILHTHNPTPHQYGAFAAAGGVVPIVVHTKHGRNQLLTTRGRLLERAAGLLTDVVVPVSADAADVARETDGVPAARIEVIRNGIAIRPLPARTRPAGYRVVHVARLNEVKDQPTLLAASRLVADAHPAFHLDLVGDGEQREALERQVDALGLRAHVTFHGFSDDVTPYLDAADLFVLSSTSEGIALTLLEAMAAGLPVVATDVGGNREVVQDGMTGFLVPARDPAALARAMRALLEDPTRAAGMGANGRARVVEEFALDRTAAAYDALYRRLLARHGLTPERAA
jgi:glycosyltransferase involved in cell wall biosynthesis